MICLPTETNISSSLMRCSVVRLHKPIWLRYYSGSTPDRAIAYIYCCKSGGGIGQLEKRELRSILLDPESDEFCCATTCLQLPHKPLL